VILFLAANPRGEDPLRLADECAEIQRELRLAPYRDDFRFESRWAVTVDELMRHVTELEPTIVHFSGHGGYGTGLVLQDEQGDPRPVAPQPLSNLIEACCPDVQVVVLNACYTAEHASALATHVDCVIGMDGPVGDEAARAFAIRFYGALGNRRPVGNAVAAGSAALAAKQFPDSGVLRCMTRDGLDASEVTLAPIATARTRHDPEEADTQALLSISSPRPPAPGTYTFIGRDHELGEIETLFAVSSEARPPAALGGFPGVGKTELARQAVARMLRGRTFTGGVLWFSAEVPDLRAQWARLAIDLDGPDFGNLDERAAWAIRQIEKRAASGKDILIVLDHVESWMPAPGPLPSAASVRLLVTTRLRSLDNSFRFYEVQPLDLDQSRALLNAIVGRTVPNADALLAALDGHALSVELAATHLREYGTTAGDYLKLLLAGKSPGSSVAAQTSYRTTAERAFKLLWQRLGDRLRLAWLTVAQLPTSWFSWELADAIGIDAEDRRGLVRLHLLERDDQGRHHMHRLLREFALAEPQDASAVRTRVVAGMTSLLETGDCALTFQRYRRDADSFDHVIAGLPNDPRDLPLKVAYATALHQLGNLAAARPLLETILAAYLVAQEVDHESVATVRATLASVLEDLGDLTAAEALCEHALASALAHATDDHARVANARASLARLLHEKGELAAARALYEQALASDLARFGDGHRTVALRRADLASLLHQQGELAAAQQLFERSLASDLASYGADHPLVAERRSSLAAVLRQLDRFDEAQALYEQALASDLRSYGESHRTVASRHGRLAALLQQRGQLTTAQVYYERALASDLATYGDHHPIVATRRGNLAGLLRQVGDQRRALDLYLRELETELAHYGDAHPSVATTRANLALVYRELHDLPRAKQLYEQALEAGIRTYHGNHQVVAMRRANLAAVYQELGQLAEARALYQQALDAALEHYPEHHSVVAKRRAHLAGVLRQLGERHEARALYQQALDAGIATYDEHHPEIATRRANMAGLLVELGDLSEARTLYEQALASDLQRHEAHHPAIARCRESLARVCLQLGDPTRARALVQQVIAAACAAYGDGHAHALASRAKLGPLLQELDEQPAEAGTSAPERP
jgi:tetratricopeptide (TPR) repeat protein